MSLVSSPESLDGLKAHLAELRALAGEMPPKGASAFSALVDALCDSLDAAHSIGQLEGMALAMTRARAILTAPPAAGRPEMAISVMLDLTLTIEEAIALMTVSAMGTKGHALVRKTAARHRGRLDA